jgi:hypothetical protein
MGFLTSDCDILSYDLFCLLFFVLIYIIEHINEMSKPVCVHCNSHQLLQSKTKKNLQTDTISYGENIAQKLSKA